MTATLSLAFEALPVTPAFPMIALAYGENGNGDKKDEAKVTLSAAAEAADTATGGAVTRAIAEADLRLVQDQSRVRTAKGQWSCSVRARKSKPVLRLKSWRPCLHLLRLRSRMQRWHLMISVAIRLLRLRLVRISLPTGSAAISPRVIRRARSSAA